MASGLILPFHLCLYLPGGSSDELACLLFLRLLFLLFVAAAVLAAASYSCLHISWLVVSIIGSCRRWLSMDDWI